MIDPFDPRVVNLMREMKKYETESSRKKTLEDLIPEEFKSVAGSREHVSDETVLLMMVVNKLDEISSKLDKLIEDKGPSK